MFFFDCETGYVPDNGQNDVTDGSVENYDFEWGTPVEQPTEPEGENQTTPEIINE